MSAAKLGLRPTPIVAAGLGLAMLAAALVPAVATGAPGTYTVMQCHALNRTTADAVFEDESAYWARNSCGGAQDDYAAKVTNTGNAQHGHSGRVSWSTRSPALGIVGVDVGAQLRRDRGHVSRLWMADRNLNEAAAFGTGSADAGSWQHYDWRTDERGARQFVASLSCERVTGCRESELAKTWVRNVRLTVADYLNPTFAGLSGSLLGTGWLRGIQVLHAFAGDSGSDLSSTVATVDGAELAAVNGNCDTIPGTGLAAQLWACGRELSLDTQPDTAQIPFHDGENALSICAFDFAGNRTCDERTVRVDNTSPQVVFASAQDTDDPELIRAPVSDATSGVSSGQILYRPLGESSWRPLNTGVVEGELQARIDSTIDPPGQYEFMAVASDIAGNIAQTTLREDGQPMVLTFPLKSGVELKAHLAGGASSVSIGYGKPSKVTGRLVDASGHPLGNEPVTVIEGFGEGALIDQRVRTVQTAAAIGASDSRPARHGRLPRRTEEVAATFRTTRRRGDSWSGPRQPSAFRATTSARGDASYSVARSRTSPREFPPAAS